MNPVRLTLIVMLTLASATLGACAESDSRTSTNPDAGGTGGGVLGTGGDDMQGGGGGSGGDIDPPDAAASCRPNPEADPECPEICPEACNDADDDCDGVVDEGADDTDCAVERATSICTRGLCILSACDEGYRDCDGARDNGCEVDIRTTEHCGACDVACAFDNTVAACVDGSCEPGECVEPYLDCDGDDGLCETFGETLSDCGGCAASCEPPPRATPACMGGTCVVDECLGNFGDCNDDAADGCELPLNTPAHCGACGVPCAFAGSATNCDGGACIIDACSPGYGDCDGSALTACDSLDQDAHCGSCGKQCTVGALENVAAAGCDTRSCVVECAAGFGDCDGVANGCETPLTGVNNCAGCGASCSPTHALGNCDDGSCQVGVCDDGWADCDGDAANGCETDTGRPEDCGGCGNQCQVNPNPIGCNGGTCTGILCPEGQADCDLNDTCEADLGDDATCGSCNVACAFDNGVDGHGSVACAVENAVPQMMAWGCEVTCADGFADCDGDYRNGCEVDLTDLNNCGGCGTVCTKSRATPTCENRVCEVGTCNLDWGDCDGDDLDCETQLNSANDCGTCGNDCDFPFAAGLCSGSPGSRSCIIQQCVPVEFENCDGQTSSGCETDTRSDAQNCNGCGNDCTVGPQVQGGVCVDSGCVFTCAPNYRDCTPSAGCETNLLAASTCGSCNNDCYALPEVTGAVCQPGGGNPVCEITGCDGGFGDCNGSPGDGCEEPTSSSLVHCGACSGDVGHQPCTGLPGVSTSACSAGVCSLVTCTGNLEDCNGVSADGCEWDPAIDGMCCDPNLDDDNDGSDNCADQCPTDPGKVTPGVCGCFVADTNSDGDGAADCIDGCPYNPNLTVDCQPRRKALTIQGSEVPSAQSDFPVVVRLSADADLAFYADPSGLDIFFEDALGNPLSFERLSYNPGTGALLAWVKLDLTGADQVFYMYYGDGDRSEKSTPASVWSSGYGGVWHLDESSGTSAADSSGNGHTGTLSGGPGWTAGNIDNGLDMDGVNDIVDLGAVSAGTGDLTLSAWARPDTATSYGHLIGKRDTNAAQQGDYAFRRNVTNGNLTFYFMQGGAWQLWTTTDPHLVSGAWKHFQVSYNQATGPVFYVNGVAVPHGGGGTAQPRPNTAGTGSSIGAWRNSGTPAELFDGIIDEARVSNVARNADWVLTEYNNQRSGSSFLNVGAGADLTCANGMFDNDETDVDCGGAMCLPCSDGLSCVGNGDCQSNRCDANDFCGSCADGMQNGMETAIDCGGSCPACHCINGMQDADEGGVDCGGADCAICGYRKPLSIDPAQVSTSLTGFPVLVRITDGDLQVSADPSGLDIYFEDGLGNALPFERESYNSATGALVAWVKMNLTGAAQDFYVYYGDGELTDKSTPSAVWDASFKGVWHLGEGGGNAETITQSGIAEGASGNVACTGGRTITSFTSRYGTNNPGDTCPVDCGGCTLGAASCSQLFDNATCGDCSNGNVKTSTLEIICGSGAPAIDSTANGHDGTQTGTAPVTGVLGNAANFASNDYITMPNAAASGLTTQLTASMWLYGDPATQPQPNFGFMIGTDAVDRISAHPPWSDGTVYWDSGGCCEVGQRISKSLSGDCPDLDNCSLIEGQWNHWVFVKNATSATASTDGAKIYINGSLWHWGDGSTQMAGSFSSFKLGSNNAGASNYSGDIDEFRVSTIERSAGWIGAEYNNQRPGSTFLNVGAEETR